MADDNMTMGYLMGQSEGRESGGGGFGGMFGEGLWIIVILAMLGFGNGFGGFGGGGAGLQGIATRADINEGFALNGLENGIRSIQQGLCDGFYAVNTGMLTGFNGVQQSMNNLGHQISDCCCATQRAIDGVNYNMSTQLCALGNTIQSTTRDIIDNQNANYRGLMDFLVQEKLSSKDARIAELTSQVSVANQNAVLRAAIDASTAEIIRRTGNDCPTPAYWVNPPTPVQAPFQGTGCGCC